MLALSPTDIFSSVNSPMGVARLWVTWIGMAVFVALLFSVLVDWMRRHHQLGTRTYVLAALLIIAIVLLIVLPRG